ncbi:MAG: KR domain-containing protein, partial [Methylovulum sp.]|nr:KR domain-containing protein [Methylovulum sp.]
LAAGVAGVLKLMLAIRHRQLPPTINYQTLNGHIDLETSPFYINSLAKDWSVPEGGCRRAAVSSFGFSGTNAHLVLEEYPTPPTPALTLGQPVLVPLSAKSAEQLKQYAEQLSLYLQTNPSVSLPCLAYTLQIGREAMGHRLAVVAITAAELREKLAKLGNGEPCPDGFSQTVGKQTVAITDTEEGQLFVRQITRKKALPKLAELWVNGCAIEWADLYQQGTVRVLAGLPGYPFAPQRYWLPETQNHPTITPALKISSQAAVEPQWDGVSYLPVWQEQAVSISNKTIDSTPACRILVYVDTAEAFAQVLADEYRRIYPRAQWVHIRLAAATSQLEANGWACGLADEQGFAKCLAAYQDIAGICFIAVDDVPPVLAAALGTHNNAIQLLRLVKALRAKMDAHAFVDCHIITQDSYRLDGSPTRLDGAGLNGLGYAIAQGDHRFLVRNIDLCAEDLHTPELKKRQALGQCVLAEAASDRGGVVKFASGRRYQQVFVKIDWRTIRPQGAFKKGGVYLILGGAGSVGRVITRCLLEQFQAKVIWLGRTAVTSPLVQDKLAMMAAFGAPPCYIQADATDLASLRAAISEAKRQYPVLDGALFSGIVFDFDNSVANTTEAQFRPILEVKTLGCVNFYRALADEPLDFLVYFSSGQAYSFSGASTLSAYATGITFADSYVQSIQNQAKFPVGTVNWGFWQSSLAETPLDFAINSLSDQDGFQVLQQFIRTLQQGYCRQILCMNASEPVRAMMDIATAERLVFNPAAALPVLAHANLSNQLLADRVAALLADPQRQALLGQLARLLFVQLRSLCPLLATTTGMDSQALWVASGVADHYQRWWQTSVALLGQTGYLHSQASPISVTPMGASIPSADEVWLEWAGHWRAYLANPQTQALVSLLDDCLRHLPDILYGKVQATDILFPDSSMAKVEGIYKNQASVDYFNTVLAESVVALVGQRLQADPQAKLRIIEIGAGTGGTTAMVLRHLRPFAEHIQDYCYTDISQAFLQHGQAHYGQDAPFLSYRLCNIEQPWLSQGLELGAYDLVIAANVLHATADMRQTLRNVKAGLRQHGALLLNEITDTSLLSHLTFGLLKGWWLYQDESLRIPGSPGLYPETWRQVLSEEGFKNAVFPAQAAHGLGQQIIIAESDGVVRQTLSCQAVSAVPEPRRQVAPIVASPQQKAGTADVGDLKPYLLKTIRNALAAALKTTPAQLDNDLPFSDYGIDSILGVGFVKQLNAALGISMNTAIIFDYATVQQLAHYILQTYPLHETDSVGQSKPANGSEHEGQALAALADKFFADELAVEALLDSVLKPTGGV